MISGGRTPRKMGEVPPVSTALMTPNQYFRRQEVGVSGTMSSKNVYENTVLACSARRLKLR